MTQFTEFTDTSGATNLEKAKRFLNSLSNPRSRYYFDDGYPRYKDIIQDATATLEVFKQLEKR